MHLNTSLYISALGHAESATAAAQALRDICDACGSRLDPHLEALLQLYHSVQSAGLMAPSSQPANLAEEGVQQVRATFQPDQ